VPEDSHRDRRELEIVVDVRDDASARLRIVGEVDVVTVQSLEDVLSRLLRSGIRHFSIDAAGIAFIDSTGLRSLLTLTRFGRDVEVVVQSPTRAVRHLLEVTCLDSVLQLE